MKKLTQDVFKGQPEEYQSAALDVYGDKAVCYLYTFKKARLIPIEKGGAFSVLNPTEGDGCFYLGGGFDPTDWQNSAIDRDDIVKSVTFDKCIDIVNQHSDWISVSERFPEPNKLVLVAIHRPQYYVPDFMYVTTADYDEVRKKWSSINLVDDLHNVVYWQPFPQLPNPPSEVQP